MMKNALLLSVSAFVLASCGVMDRLKPKPKAPEVQIVAPLDATQVLPPPGAQTAEALDTSTEAEKAAAVAAPVAGARELGKVSVA